MISNGLIALCGSLFAQNDGFSDVTSGTGTIVVGLSAVYYCGSFDTRLDHWRSLVIHRNWCYCLPLIILNIYEIPNLDQNLVRLFNAILLALVFICTRIAKETKDSWFETEK